MIKLVDIIFEEADDEEFDFIQGYVNVPVTLFGKLCFDEEGGEKLGLFFAKELRIKDVLAKVNEYIKFLSGCRELLANHYKKALLEGANEPFNMPVWTTTAKNFSPENWYETLEIDNATIEIASDGSMGAGFSCLDIISPDHILIIEFDEKEITEMCYEG